MESKNTDPLITKWVAFLERNKAHKMPLNKLRQKRIVHIEERLNS